MKIFNKNFIGFLAVTSISLSPITSYATSFTVNNGQTNNANQSLDGNNETGVIQQGGTLDVNGANAIDVTSNDVSITNNGEIVSTNNGVNSSGDNTNIDNNGIITSTGGDAVDSSGDNLTVDNSGTINSFSRGLQITGSNAEITNSGTLNATADGINTANSNNSQITNSGSIVSGEIAIDTNGDNSTITNSGSIVSDNDGIEHSGANSVITNSGTINSANDTGIDASGDDAIITNSGDITAVNGNGILASGNNNRISSSGTITAGDDGIRASSFTNNVEIINSGTISAGDDGIDGTRVDNIVIINSGTITADDVGIFSNGDGSSITNSGTITSNNDEAIETSGDNTIITNSGNITAETDNAVQISGNNSSFNNSGTIRSSNNGINFSGADGGTITNSGTINADIAGIDHENDNGVINNSGEIRSLNSGIISEGNNSEIVNSGNITVSQNANGIGIHLNTQFNTDSQTLTNSGTISATGNSSQAIVGGDGSETVNLQRGSRIFGTIDLGGGTDTVNINTNNISGRLLLNNVENINLNTVGVVVGNEVHFIDPTSVSMITTNINNLTLDIHNSINSRINSPDNGDGENKLWIQAFGSQFERGSENNNLAYTHDRAGFIAGYEIGKTNKLGFIFGVSKTNSETDRERSFESDSHSFFGGVYKHFNLITNLKLSTNLIAGYERYKTQRHIIDNINGNETANSDFGNYFISPSLNLDYKVKITDIFELHPHANLNYTNSFITDQRENGTTSSNLNIKSRKIQTLNSRIGLSTVLNLKYYQLRVGGGFQSRFIEEDDVSASIGGNNFTYTPYNDQQVNGHYLNLGFDILRIDNLVFGINTEIIKADGNEDITSGRVNVGYSF